MEEKSRHLTVIAPHNPKFNGSTILLSDPELFEKPLTGEPGAAALPQIKNQHLNSEVRGFIEDIILKRHFTVESAKQYINHLCSLSFICTGRAYEKAESFSDIDKNTFISDVTAGLREHGYQVTKKSHRRFDNIVRFYEWVYEVQNPHNGFRFEDDIWRTSDVIEKYHPQTGPRNAEHIRFSDLENPWLKNAAKHVFLWQIHFVGLTTNIQYIYSLTHLDSFMQENGMQDLSHFDRDDAEELTGYLHGRLPSSSSYNQVLGAIETFMKTAALRHLKGVTEMDVFLKTDRRRKPKPDPHPFSDRELSAILKHAKELPDICRDALITLLLQGYRSSDLCAARILKPDGTPALTFDEDEEGGGWMIYLYQYKTRKWSLFPLQEAAGRVLKRRIELSKLEYGQDCEYIFAVGPRQHLQTEYLRRELRKMVQRNEIKGDDGKPLRIGNLHRFRQTVASELIRLSNDPEMVHVFLGQVDDESLGHYIKLSNAERIAGMKKIHQENDSLIQNIGEDTNVLDDKSVPQDAGEKQLIPLSNGFCGKPGNDICSHANACLNCSMFVPSKRYLQVYEFQRRKLKIAKAAAEMEGYDTIAEHDEGMIRKLDKIIHAIQGGETA